MLKLKDMLLALENEMCVLGTPLTKAFEDVSKDNPGSVWASLFGNSSAIMLSQSLDAGTAWRKALTALKDSVPLDDTEFGLVADFGDQLGRSDREMQRAVLSMMKDKVRAMEERAGEAVETTGKLYRNLGALIGAAVVILLI